MRPWWRDVPLLLALAAGPAAWGALALLGRPVAFGAMVGSEPLHYLMLVLLYPVLEELAFRGLIQGELRKWSRGVNSLGPISVANLITSALFAAFHLWHHSPLWALLVLFPSLLFGYFRDRDNSLRLPIALHIYYNGGFFLIFAA